MISTQGYGPKGENTDFIKCKEKLVRGLQAIQVTESDP
jgi:hypothetical protein